MVNNIIWDEHYFAFLWHTTRNISLHSAYGRMKTRGEAVILESATATHPRKCILAKASVRPGVKGLGCGLAISLGISFGLGQGNSSGRGFILVYSLIHPFS